MKRKIAAIMAADVAGYSRLVAEDEDDALQRLLSYREVFADFVGRGGGRIFNTAGDAVLAEFPSAVEALRAAIDIQEGIRTRNLSVAEHRHMRFRIGLTIGDVVERDGDLLGDGVNIAARLESLAEPGGICLSRSLHEQVGNKLSVVFRDIGLQSVKNIPVPIHAYTVPANIVDVPVEIVPPPGRRRGAAILAFCVLVGLGVGLAALIGIVIPHKGAPPSLTVAKPAAPPAAAPPTPSTQHSATLIYGPVAQARAKPAASPRFDASRIPFVCDACRARIGAVMAQGRNGAVAISVEGASGVMATRDTVEQAKDDAKSLCNSRNLGTCEVYAVNDDVVWPRPLPPMPRTPWVEATPRTPFDVARLGGISEADRTTLATAYAPVQTWKALAMGPHGAWAYYNNGATQDEVVRRALERCGEQAGFACRVVAVGNEFVVAATDGPVDEAGGAVTETAPPQ